MLVRFVLEKAFAFQFDQMVVRHLFVECPYQPNLNWLMDIGCWNLE